MLRFEGQRQYPPHAPRLREHQHHTTTRTAKLLQLLRGALLAQREVVGTLQCADMERG